MKSNLPILFLTLAISCKKIERLEKLPLDSNKIVVVCLIKSEDSFSFKVYKSLSVLDNARLSRMLEDAEIILYEEDIPVDTVRYNSVTKKYLSQKVVARAGFKYGIRVSVPGLETVTSEMRVPTAFKDVKGEFISTSKTFYLDEHDYHYKLNCRLGAKFTVPDNVAGAFMDISETWSYDSGSSQKMKMNHWLCANSGVEELRREEYYSFQIPAPGIQYKTFHGGHPNRYTFASPSVENSNKKFDFFTKSDACYYRKRADSILFFNVYVQAFSIGAYEHLKTINYYSLAKYDLFSEPIQVSSNITNGYGVFGAYSDTTIKVPLTK